jgi:hypothetical protein
MEDAEDDELRPADWARFLLAASGLPPRDRARDQQADLLGEDLRRQILGRVVDLDPRADAFEAALMEIVADSAQADGPIRGVALTVLQEWEQIARSPALRSFLLREALEAPRREERSRSRRRPS